MNLTQKHTCTDQNDKTKVLCKNTIYKMRSKNKTKQTRIQFVHKQAQCFIAATDLYWK